MKHKVEPIKDEFVPGADSFSNVLALHKEEQVTVDQQITAIEQLRVDILVQKKELLDMQYRLGQYERGLERMRRELRKAS